MGSGPQNRSNIYDDTRRCIQASPEATLKFPKRANQHKHTSMPVITRGKAVAKAASA